MLSNAEAASSSALCLFLFSSSGSCCAVEGGEQVGEVLLLHASFASSTEGRVPVAIGDNAIKNKNVVWRWR